MGHAAETLAIIVNSNRYFEFVTNLADAAVDSDKVVCIHLLGDGCEFAGTQACKRLSHKTRVTMCEKCACRTAQGGEELGKERISIVPPQELTRLLQRCDRHVVF